MIYKDIKLSRKQFYVYLEYPFITTDLNAYRITIAEKNAASITVTAKRADGSTASCIDTAQNGCILPQDIYSVPGEVKLFISVSDENGSIVTENEVTGYVKKGFDAQHSAGNQNTSSLAVTAYNTANEAKEVAETAASSVANKADKATTLSGYGITDAYTKDESDTLRGYVRLSVSDLKTVLEEVEAVLDEVIDYQENYPSDYILEAISPDGDDLIATPSQDNLSIDTTE